VSLERKRWIVAYDIADPRRLRAVHRTVRQFGVALQYSAFQVLLTDAELKSLLQALEHIIDDQADDVRAYHVPASCKVWTTGAPTLPDGVTLDAAQAAGLLLGAATRHPDVSPVPCD
jgi:CRISPR-associated protein Cas2